MLAPFNLLLGPTSWYLQYVPALAYASDHHMIDVIGVILCPGSPVICLQCFCHRSIVSIICIIRTTYHTVSEHSQEFYLDYNRD